jgi:hypothetical protein
MASMFTSPAPKMPVECPLPRLSSRIRKKPHMIGTLSIVAIVDKVLDAVGYVESASENLADLEVARYSPT